MWIRPAASLILALALPFALTPLPWQSLPNRRRRPARARSWRQRRRDWVAIAPAQLLVMDLAPTADGAARRW
jgi:peptidylprolyl isomerase